ncbi:MAG: hypothetical protein ACI9Y1_001204 [Lentisphaeria bacterium]
MKRALFITCLFSVQTMAGSGANSGSALTTGPSSSHYSLYAGSSNPAMGSLLISEDDSSRITYLPSVSFGFEIGEVDNFADDLDELIELLDDPGSITEPQGDVLDRFNLILEEMGEAGYIKNTVAVNAPLFPMYIRSERFGGYFGADISAGLDTAVRILDAELRADPIQGFQTNTSIYLKSGINTTFGLSYSRDVWSRKEAGGRENTLYAGAKFKVINMDLSKQVIWLESLDGKDVGDVISDEYDTNLNSSTGIALDIGFVWDADWYRAGLTLENINSPSFSYGAVGVDCVSRGEDNPERSACDVAQFFIAQGRIKAGESHTMHALVQVDGLVQVTDRWHVSSTLDLAEYDDVVGFSNQWFHLATSYESRGFWLPSARVGYHTNLAGTKLSSMNFGLTFFKVLSLDVEWGLESIEVDGSTAPQLFGFAIGFEEKF